MNTSYKNEQLKRKFYEHLKVSKGFSEETIKCHEKAIYLWEDFTNKADFRNFNQKTAEAFREWLKNKRKGNSENSISISYCYHNLRFVKAFFEWLSKQAGYRLKINPTSIEYLNLTKKETHEATQPKIVKYPNLEDIKKVIENIQVKILDWFNWRAQYVWSTLESVWKVREAFKLPFYIFLS